MPKENTQRLEMLDPQTIKTKTSNYSITALIWNHKKFCWSESRSAMLQNSNSNETIKQYISCYLLAGNQLLALRCKMLLISLGPRKKLRKLLVFLFFFFAQENKRKLWIQIWTKKLKNIHNASIEVHWASSLCSIWRLEFENLKWSINRHSNSTSFNVVPELPVVES